MKTRLASALSTIVAVWALSACGGGTDAPAAPATPSGDTPPPAAAASAPGGIYLGYYEEDATTNPEDPTVGAVALSLPEGSAPFSGAMYFTYVGCQTENIGAIAGNKIGGTIDGTWNGVLDGRSKNGTFVGTYQEALAQYTGTFTVSGPKEHIVIPDCGGEPFAYYVAPNGTFELFAQGTNRPATFNVNVQAGNLRWTATANAAAVLGYIADPAKLGASGSPIVWQHVEYAPLSTASSMAIAIADELTPGKTYIAVVVLLNNQGERIAFGSKSFQP